MALKKCSIRGCVRKYSCKGFCSCHYYTRDPVGISIRKKAQKKYYSSIKGIETKRKADKKYSLSESGKKARKRATKKYCETKGGIESRKRRKKKRILFEKKNFPVWANKNKIREMYSSCPVGHQVDHIIPIINENVCGLHVEYNLQYLPGTENQKKWNKFDL